MIYITKQEGLYQNKVNSSLVSTSNITVKWAIGQTGIVSCVTHD